LIDGLDWRSAHSDRRQIAPRLPTMGKLANAMLSSRARYQGRVPFLDSDLSALLTGIDVRLIRPFATHC
jgi:hypothetical protein